MDTANISNQVSEFFTFINDKLNHFSELTRGEQVSYISIGFGVLLMLVSMFLWIL